MFKSKKQEGYFFATHPNSGNSPGLPFKSGVPPMPSLNSNIKTAIPNLMNQGFVQPKIKSPKFAQLTSFLKGNK